jgi:broad specificity phosphatase PhoE
VVRDRRFNEVSRAEPWEGNYLELRCEHVDGANHAGWEARCHVEERFGAAVSDHLSAADSTPVIIATHGMAMTIWLAAAIGLPDPAGFWCNLRFADAHRVDLGAGTLTRIA